MNLRLQTKLEELTRKLSIFDDFINKRAKNKKARRITAPKNSAAQPVFKPIFLGKY